MPGIPLIIRYVPRKPYILQSGSQTHIAQLCMAFESLDLVRRDWRRRHITCLVWNLACRFPLEGIRQDLLVNVRADSRSKLPVGIGVMRRHIPRVPERFCIWCGTAKCWVVFGWWRVWIFERGDGNRHLELAFIKLMRLSIDSDQDVCSFWGNDDVVVQYQILRDAEASMRGSACLTPETRQRDQRQRLSDLPKVCG